MKTLWTCLLTLCCLATQGLFAQTNTSAEKLISRLKVNSKLDSKRFYALDDLTWHYQNKNFERATYYAKMSLELSKKINYKKGECTAYVRLGLIDHNQGKYDSSLYYCQRSLEVAENIKYGYGMARAKNEIGIVYMLRKNYNKAITYFKASILVLRDIKQGDKIGSKKANLAVCYKNLGDFKAAIKHYQEAIDIYNKHENKSQVGESYLGLGVVYQRTNNYNTAYDYLQKALKVFQEGNNKLFLAKTYHELGFLHNNLENFTEAIINYQNSLRLLKELKTTQNAQVTFNNLGHVYLKQAQFNKAKIWLDKGLDLALQKKDTLTMALVYNNLGWISFKAGQHTQAIDYYNRSLSFSDKAFEKYNKRRVLKSLSIVYARLGNYKRAFGYFRQYHQAKDSLETSFRQAMDLKDAYQKEKQQSEILKKNQTIQQKELARLRERSRRQEIFNYFLGVSLFLLLIIVLTMVRNYQARQKSRQRQNKIDELLNEQEFIALSKMLEGQEQERKRIAQDLHDRLGGILAMVQSHFSAMEHLPETASIQETPQYQKATELLDNACDEVRKVAHNMASSILRKFGLMPALFELKESLAQANALAIDVIDTGFDDHRLPVNYESQIYHIVQEMVSNVLKHAQAQKLEIQLLWTANNLHISVEDDGKGFNIQKMEAEGSMGLRGIESRVSRLDGTCTIDSTEGVGTIIMIDLPV